jgi:predicted O-methyltransferase YrrM
MRSEMELSEGSSADPSKLYDIVYIDANKREYCEYYELVFDMIRPGGLILADNVLWDGKVCQDPLPQDKQTLGIARFNDMVSTDPRVESVILPLRDGLNVIRKK